MAAIAENPLGLWFCGSLAQAGALAERVSPCRYNNPGAMARNQSARKKYIRFGIKRVMD
jgi:hypothetical protein